MEESIILCFPFQILYSHPCSLQILHEDEVPSSHAVPPPPLAAFGGIGPKMTATELRRTRMMNKQMSEDCAPARRPVSGHYDEGSRRSLQKLTERCEMRDMTGRSMHDRKATRSIRGIKKQYSLALSDAAV